MQQPRVRIPHLRIDVKECCTEIVTTDLLTIGSASTVVEAVNRQLKVQLHFSGGKCDMSVSNCQYDLMCCQSGLLGAPQRTRPYRNGRIISAIRAEFFTGGNKSFGSVFEHLFPVHEDMNGVPTREVPAPMVALVATAVSWGVTITSHANSAYSCMLHSVSGVAGSNR